MAEASVIERTRVLLNAPRREGFLLKAMNFLVVGLKRKLFKDQEWQFIENLEMQKQRHDEWCWAAVASTIAKCFKPSSNCEQCRVTNDQIKIAGKHPCTSDDPGFDEPGSLQDALKFVDCLSNMDTHVPMPNQPGVPIRQRPTLERIQTELGAGNPVCIRIKWTKDPSDEEAHFIVIAGFRDTAIAVLDSRYGHDPQPFFFDAFPSSYSGLESLWTHTYFTKSGDKNCAA